MKKFIKYIFVLISLGLFLNLCILGFKTKYFNVNEISIKGKNEIIKNDIVQKLNSIKGKNQRNLRKISSMIRELNRLISKRYILIS